MRFGIVQFPGSNCDYDCYYAIRDVLNVSVEMIWHKENNVDGFDCLVLPGGFSYGDYLRAGAIARYSPIMLAVTSFAQKGGLVLGICNGFQVLTEAQLLPGALTRNECLHFICKQQTVRVENIDSPYTNLYQEKQVLKMPIAHGEGCYYADKKTIDELEANHQILFRYCDPQGKIIKDSNPNGSVSNIAGICNKQRNVLGLMPHPERCTEMLLGSADGRLLFESIIKFVEDKNRLPVFNELN